MTILKYNSFPKTDSDRQEFIRRTRTVCINSRDRPKGIYSKNLVRIVVSSSDTGIAVNGVFCVDSVDSKLGFLVGHASHFKNIPEGSDIDVEISHATPHDCVEWLKNNDDPERKSLGEILNFALEGAEEARLISKTSQENFEEAKRDRLIAAQDKKKGVLYGIAGFLGGIIFDVGMLEEKLGIEIPLFAIVILFAATIIAIIAAFKFIGSDTVDRDIRKI